MFLRSNKLEQLEFKVEKIMVKKLLGFRNMQEKLENNLRTFFVKYNF